MSWVVVCKFTLRDAWPLMLTMKPTPQAAFSNLGSNKDDFVIDEDDFWLILLLLLLLFAAEVL